MYQYSYAEIMEDSLALGRGREREVLDRCVEMLAEAERKEGFTREAIAALDYTRRVWIALLEDLSCTENQLGDELKANLISIGIWIVKECDLIRRKQSRNYAGMIDIIRTISCGLL